MKSDNQSIRESNAESNTTPPVEREAPVHTPGPWQARGRGEDCRVVQKPQSLADRYYPIVICECSQEAEENQVSPDALLIAAAPDLLEAAKATEQCITDFLEAFKNDCARIVLDEAVSSLKNDALKLVRAAIAKAEGDASQ